MTITLTVPHWLAAIGGSWWFALGLGLFVGLGLFIWFMSKVRFFA